MNLFTYTAFVTCVFASSVSGNWHSIEECRQVQRMLEPPRWGIPGCSNAVGHCFQQSHHLAKHCMHLEMQNEKTKECNEKPDILEDYQDWILKSCVWHQALIQCVNGTELPDKFATDVAGKDNHKSSGHQDYDIPVMQNPQCWRDMGIKLASCNQLAESECPNYKLCEGSEHQDTDDEKMKKWHKVAAKLHRKKMEAMHEYTHNLQICMKQGQDKDI